jgi:hypothetical protein
MPNMRFSMAVVVLLPGTAILAAQSEPSGSPTWSNVPPADEFLRLTGGTGELSCLDTVYKTRKEGITADHIYFLVALLGDRVYYDGGLISQRGFETYLTTRPSMHPDRGERNGMPVSDVQIADLIPSERDPVYRPLPVLDY